VLLEHVVTSSITKHLEYNNILYDLQHGFRSSRSCETQLVSFIQDLAKSSDKLNNVVKIGAICVVHSLSILPCILSGPDALWIFIFCNNLLIPFSVMIILGICGY
jgi:hypothetical protein